MKYVSLLALAAFIALAGCNSSTSSSSGPTVVVPNTGSSWMLSDVFLDSVGTVKRADTATRTVVMTNMSYQGYNDVAMIVETHSLSSIAADTVYLRYLSSGDISRLSSPNVAPQLPVWLTIPYYTHNTYSTNWGGNIASSTYTHDTLTFTASYVADGSDTVAGIVYPTSTITSSSWEHLTSSGAKDSTISVTQTNSFIRSKGISGNRSVSLHVINGKQVQREQQTLIGVSLK